MVHAVDAEEILHLRSLSATVLAQQPDAVCALARALDDARPEVGQAAAATLEKMVRLHRLRPQHMTAGFPPEARSILLDRLARSDSAMVRRLAADALREAEQVEAAAGFLDGLADPDPAVRASCLGALERLRLAPSHLPRIQALLAADTPAPAPARQPDARDHDRAAAPDHAPGHAPGHALEHAPDHAPDLNRAHDHARAARCAILDALAAHMDRDLLRQLAPALAALLADAQVAVRIRAAHLLMEPPHELLPTLWTVLTETLAHGDPWQRTTALQRLAAQSPRDAAHLPPILAATLAAAGDHNPAVRSYALTALAAMAPADARVRQTLLAALADPDSPPRRAAVSALAAAGPDTNTIAALADTAGDTARPSTARTAAIEVLGALRAVSAVPALTRALDPAEPALAEAATEALGRMGPAARLAAADARQAADALERLLGHPELRMSAAAALVSMDAVSPRLRTALRIEAREGEGWSRDLAESLLDELA